MKHGLIELYKGFDIQSGTPIDNRLVLNQADLDALALNNDPSLPTPPYDNTSLYYLPKWPDHYFFLKEEDGQIYEFKRQATTSVPSGFTCNWSKVTFKLDDKTVIETSEGKISVPIDNASIIVDPVDGKLKATAKPLDDGGVATEVVADGDKYQVDVLFDDATIKVDNTNKLYIPIDQATLKINSEGKLYSVPESLLAQGKATELTYDAGAERVDVRVDSESIIIDANNDLAVKLGIALALNNGISVQFKDPIKVDVDNKLYVDVDALTVLVNSEGKLEMPLKAGKALEITPDFKKIDVLTDDSTIEVNSENKLEVRIDEDKALDVNTQGLFVKVDDLTIKTSEGKLQAQYKAGDALELTGVEFDVLYDDKTIKLDSEGRLTAIPEPLFDGHATKVNPKTAAYDSESIDVLHDETLKLVAGNKLRVNIDEKTLKDSSGELYVAVDNDSIFYDASEGVLKAKAVPVNPGHAMNITGNVIDVLFDDKTIKEAGDKKLYVPLDSETLVYSGNKVLLNKDNDTIYYSTSEGKVKAKQMHIDGKTIVWHNDVDDSYIETVIGGWSVAQDDYIVVNNDNSVSYTDAGKAMTFNLSSLDAGQPVLNDKLHIEYTLNGVAVSTDAIWHTEDYFGTPIDCIEIPMGGLTAVGYISGGDFVFRRSDNLEWPATWRLAGSPSPMDIRSLSTTRHYEPIDGNYIPVDNDSIVLDANGQLHAVAKDLVPGEAISVGADYSINVKYDNDTIVLNSEGKLEAVKELPPYSSSEEDKFLRVTSDGSLEWAPAGKVDDVLFDGVTVVGTDKVARFVKATTAEYGLVKFDGDELIVNSDGQLELGHRYVEDFILKDSEGVRSIVDSANEVHLDLSNYSLIPETANKIQLFMDGIIPSSEGSEGSLYRITAKLLDKNGVVIDESNVLDLPLEATVIDGHVETESETSYLVLVLHNGKKIRIPMSSVVGGFIDTRSDYIGTGSIYGNKNFAGELMNYGVEVITQVQVDNKTIMWNDSEVYLEMILPDEGDAVEIKDLGSKYELNVKYDDKTIKLDAVPNELYLNNDEKTIIYDVVKDKVLVPIDEETIFVDSADELVKVNLDKKTLIVSEGKVAVNLDYETIIYDDSEKVVKLPLDQVTIYINSEGLLEAAGLDVKEGKAIEIESSEQGGLPVKLINVLYDEETILLDSEGKLSVPIDRDSIIIDSEGLLAVDQYTISEIRTLWHNVCVEGEA